MKSMVRIARHRFSMTARQKILASRSSRLNQNDGILPIFSANNNSTIRNVGTIAHIDAGKTTLTERLLYFCGALPAMGEVHDGNTVMDYMKEERERGITITSACITFKWQQYHINLIDTPGHADFNFEVERALKVLDGAIVIIDGVKGVEAQTETVWRQANKHQIPKIIAINKLDRPGADFDKSIEDVERRFDINCLRPFIPVIENDIFKGIIDILHNTYYTWTEPEALDDMPKFNEVALVLDNFNDAIRKEYTLHLENLIETVTDVDPSIFENYMEGKNISYYNEKLIQALRKIIFTNTNKFCVAIPCSALKSKGITKVLDSIGEFLPPPLTSLADTSDPLGFVFKTLVHKELGLLSFVKVFSGKINKGTKMMNHRTKAIVSINEIFRVRADEFISIDSASSGDIIAIPGINGVVSGDNLHLEHSSTANKLMKGYQAVEPLFFTSIEFGSSKDKTKFMKLINTYLLEDPSLKYEDNKDTGQILLKGLGELHIDIIISRLKNEHGINCKIGKTTVPFKETINGFKKLKETFKQKIKGKLYYIELEFEVMPLEFETGQEPCPSETVFDIFGDDTEAYNRFEKFIQIMDSEDNELKVRHLAAFGTKIDAEPLETTIEFEEGNFEQLYPLKAMDFNMLYELKQNIEDISRSGPLSYSQLTNTQIRITGGSFNPRYISIPIIRQASSSAFSKLITKTDINVLEPNVKIKIDTPNIYGNEIANEAVSRRHANVNSLNSGPKMTSIELNMPLLCTLNYANYLRSTTKGEISFTIENRGYVRMLDNRRKQMSNEF